jgi:hypothetical protein
VVLVFGCWVFGIVICVGVEIGDEVLSVSVEYLVLVLSVEC